MGVPAEDTPMFKSAKSTRHSVVRVYSIMTYLILGTCAIYIILMSLPYWAD